MVVKPSPDYHLCSLKQAESNNLWGFLNIFEKFLFENLFLIKSG